MFSGGHTTSIQLTTSTRSSRSIADCIPQICPLRNLRGNHRISWEILQVKTVKIACKIAEVSRYCGKICRILPQNTGNHGFAYSCKNRMPKKALIIAGSWWYVRIWCRRMLKNTKNRGHLPKIRGEQRGRGTASPWRGSQIHNFSRCFPGF